MSFFYHIEEILQTLTRMFSSAGRLNVPADTVTVWYGDFWVSASYFPCLLWFTIGASIYLSNWHSCVRELFVPVVHSSTLQGWHTGQQLSCSAGTKHDILHSISRQIRSVYHFQMLCGIVLPLHACSILYSDGKELQSIQNIFAPDCWINLRSLYSHSS